MAWDWVDSVVGAAGGIVGVVTTWSVAFRDRKARALERQEQRCAETYVDLLVQINHDWIPALSTQAIVVGDRPEPRLPEEEMLLRARVDAFGSPAVRDLYAKLMRAIHLVVWTHGIVRDRDFRRVNPPPANVITQEPTEVRDLSDAELAALKDRRWKAAEQARETLVDQIRRELGGKR